MAGFVGNWQGPRSYTLKKYQIVIGSNLPFEFLCIFWSDWGIVRVAYIWWFLQPQPVWQVVQQLFAKNDGFDIKQKN